MKSLRRILLAAPLILIVVLLFRYIDIDVFDTSSGDPVVTVGGETYCTYDYDAMETVKTLFPLTQDDEEIFPADKSVSTLLVETAVLLEDARKYRKSLYETPRWELLQTYWKGRVFYEDVVSQNLGFSDEEIQEYFTRNASAFVGDDAESGDETYRAFRNEIADSLFLQTYDIPQDFIESHTDKNSDEIAQVWLTTVRREPRKFFLSRYYKDLYGESMPGNIRTLVGASELISYGELEELLSWLPGKNITKEERYQYAVFILGWKVFGAVAEKRGYTETDSFKRGQEWFDSFSLVHYYVNTVLPEKVGLYKKVYEDHLKYVYWDRYGFPLKPYEQDLFANLKDQYRERMREVAQYKYIHDLRSQKGVSFENSDFADVFDTDPETLFTRADSLFSQGNISESRNIFEHLRTYYAFTDYGLQSLTKIAEIYKKDNLFRRAIEAYREYILLSVGSGADLCREYFMIGMIYGDRLNRYEQAAANYAWILKNAPNCSMSEDAEFMYLNLGEPIPGIQELKARTMRQGQTVK
ncbi:MAG: hypothetical protein ACQEQ4_02970 [Fibrobacterota bacterium]